MLSVYKSTKHLGFFDEHLYTIKTEDNELATKFEALKEEILSSLIEKYHKLFAAPEEELLSIPARLMNGLQEFGYHIFWARKHDKCRMCGTTDRRHVSGGLCSVCYANEDSKKYRSEANSSALENLHARKLQSQLKFKAILNLPPRRHKQITKEFLYQKYKVENKSVGEIAVEVGCSRSNIHRRLLKLLILPRNQSEAREMAVQAGKKLKKADLNEEFFSNWSPEMAYVLGVIYTDGNLAIMGNKRIPNAAVYGRLSVVQKEPELLQKVLALMNCDAKLHFTPRRTYKDITVGELFYFHIQNQRIYEDLLKLGLSPNKSMILEFPDMPPQHTRHFIRGCWDGDGSVYHESDSSKLAASFVSGSLKFIQGMLAHLEEEGFAKRTIHQVTRKNTSYYFRFHNEQCKKLYSYLYENVPETMYLSRKFNAFVQSFGSIVPPGVPSRCC